MVFSANSIRPTEVRVDLKALASNLRCFQTAVGQNVKTIAVLKADAYGHGAVPVARLLEGLGVWGFGVATVDEGVELREAGIRIPIIVMGAAFGKDHEEVIHQKLTPMVGDPGDVAHFARAASRLGQARFSIHVKVDTGMTRLGVTCDLFAEFLKLCGRFPSIRVDGLATHFSSSDDPDPDPTEAQLTAFIHCLDEARAMGADPQIIHAANSAAALRFPKTRFDLVRPGIALYGAMSNAWLPNPGIIPVLSFYTHINALRKVGPDTPVSYNGTFVTKRSSIIATLPVGYADGYPRSISNRAQVIVRGKRADLVGAVCMDLCMIDVTDIPDVEVGDLVTLLGGEGDLAIRPEELASWAKTIPYEVLCCISKRVPRIYPGLTFAEPQRGKNGQ